MRESPFVYTLQVSTLKRSLTFSLAKAFCHRGQLRGAEMRGAGIE
jgi:hypothetical protein